MLSLVGKAEVYVRTQMIYCTTNVLTRTCTDWQSLPDKQIPVLHIARPPLMSYILGSVYDSPGGEAAAWHRRRCCCAQSWLVGRRQDHTGSQRAQRQLRPGAILYTPTPSRGILSDAYHSPLVLLSPQGQLESFYANDQGDQAVHLDLLLGTRSSR